MWILIKVSVSLFIFCVRLWAKKLKYRFTKWQEYDGVQHFLNFKFDKGNVVGTTLSFPIKHHSIFKITRESSWDIFFQKIGFSDEIQTNDAKFDQTLYIASDSSVFRQELKRNQKLRELILDIFTREDCESIYCDGAHLELSFRGDRLADMDLAISLYRLLSSMEQSWKGFFNDRFASKAILIEALIWSLAAYSFVGFFEWTLSLEDLHLNSRALFNQGLLLGAGIAVVLILIVALFMRGSSRGHRILVESLLVLGFSLPIGGIRLASDLNTKLDKSEAVALSAKILGLEEQVKSGRRGRKYSTYHLEIRLNSEAPTDFNVPSRIQISSEDFYRLEGKTEVLIKVGSGYLNHFWYRSFSPL